MKTRGLIKHLINDRKFSDANKIHFFTLKFHLTKVLKWEVRVKSLLVEEKISMRLKNISNLNLKISMKIKQRDGYCLL